MVASVWVFFFSFFFLRCLITDTSTILVSFLITTTINGLLLSDGAERLPRKWSSRRGQNGQRLSVGCCVGAIIVWLFPSFFFF